MSIANRDQAERWNEGEDVTHWITNQVGYDRMLAPFTYAILAAAKLRSGDRVLDVGCGCGATTRTAARIVKPGEAVGLDLSFPMLARARSDAESDGLKNAAFIEGDAQTYDFETGSFDSVISRFGVMFFSEPVTAFANLRRATRRGGQLAFVCWQPLTENEWLLVPGAALAEYVLLPDPGPPDAPGMFAFADPDRVRGLLAKAGWDVTEITSLRPSIQIGGSPSLDEAVDFLRTGSLGRAVLASVDPQTEERAVGSVRAALRRYSDSDGVRLSAAVWVVKATS